MIQALWFLLSWFSNFSEFCGKQILERSYRYSGVNWQSGLQWSRTHLIFRHFPRRPKIQESKRRGFMIGKRFVIHFPAILFNFYFCFVFIFFSNSNILKVFLQVRLVSFNFFIFTFSFLSLIQNKYPFYLFYSPIPNKRVYMFIFFLGFFPVYMFFLGHTCLFGFLKTFW